jgi:hypothetical protein
MPAARPDREDERKLVELTRLAELELRLEREIDVHEQDGSYWARLDGVLVRGNTLDELRGGLEAGISELPGSGAWGPLP